VHIKSLHIIMITFPRYRGLLVKFSCNVKSVY